MKDKRRERIKNRTLLKSCVLHDFPWRESVAAAIERKKARELRTGVSVPLYLWQVQCRCKNCGGKISVRYAGPYMDAVHHMRRIYERSNQEQ